MPVESATYISDLNTTNPVATDDVSDGATHLRLIKSVLKATFSGLTGAVTASQTALNAAATAFATTGIVTVAMGSTASSVVLRGSTDASTMSSDITVTNTAGALTVTRGSSQVLSVDTSGNYVFPGTVTAASFKMSDGTALSDFLVPSGSIMGWNGATTNIPTGWVLCDGRNGTPDLRDRFIVGAGLTYSVGNTGGSASASLTAVTAGAHDHSGATGSAGSTSGTATSTTAGSHSHGANTAGYTLTVNDIPSHTHSLTGSVYSLGSGSGSFFAAEGAPNNSSYDPASVGGGGSHLHGISADGAHTHDVSFSVPAHTHAVSTDGSHTHTVTGNTLPPYYALAFIMKT